MILVAVKFSMYLSQLISSIKVRWISKAFRLWLFGPIKIL